MITNIRYGFATNSSSTHSLVFRSDLHDGDVGSGEFGWGFWTAASPEARKLYSATLLKHSLAGRVSPELAVLIASGASGIPVAELEESCIDHQSTILIPCPHPGPWYYKDTVDVSLPFWRDLDRYLTQPGLAILGGNDNGGDEHPSGDRENDASLRIPKDSDDENWYAVKHEVNGYWALFNKRNGTKYRVKFERNPAPPQKADNPELVDLKITDYCTVPRTATCAGCYQNSGVNGKHADYDYVLGILFELSQNGCFEIALGGGEPTSHPRFWDIVDKVASLGMKPNFTTRNISFMTPEFFDGEQFEKLGGIALSVETEAEARSAVEKLPFITRGSSRVIDYAVSAAISFQIVDGMVSKEEFLKILDLCCQHHIRLTILGHKMTGRATAPLHSFNWLETFLEWKEQPRKWCNLGVDTTIAKKFGPELLKAGVSSKYFELHEGKFSCYIDAVAKKMGPSSFCAVTEFAQIPDHGMNEFITSTFRGY